MQKYEPENYIKPCFIFNFIVPEDKNVLHFFMWVFLEIKKHIFGGTANVKLKAEAECEPPPQMRPKLILIV